VVFRRLKTCKPRHKVRCSYLTGPPAATGGKFPASFLDTDCPNENNYLGVLQSIGGTTFCESQGRPSAQGGQKPYALCVDTLIDFPRVTDSLVPWPQGNDFGRGSYRKFPSVRGRRASLARRSLRWPSSASRVALHVSIGMTPRTIQRLMKRVANRARIIRTVTPHVLQHTYAMAAVQKGISLPALQRLLG
jgi:hypothetical protein